MKGSLQATVALAKVGGLVITVGTRVLAALDDGISADEAEDIALAAFEGEDLSVRVKGADILDDVAQAHLIAAVARLARNVVAALSPAPAE